MHLCLYLLGFYPRCFEPGIFHWDIQARLLKHCSWSSQYPSKCLCLCLPSHLIILGALYRKLANCGSMNVMCYYLHAIFQSLPLTYVSIKKICKWVPTSMMLQRNPNHISVSLIDREQMKEKWSYKYIEF